MGTTLPPWAVPVEVVASDAVAPPPTRSVLVDPGRPLPGIVALRLLLGRARGREVLLAVEPVHGPAPDGPLTPLALALLGLGRPVPVVVRGTTLRRRIAAELAAVPPGEVITYAELAARAGVPRAVRATASAMAENRTPLLLPCHRVVPAAGGVGRYGWGSDVKAALLAHEGATVPT